eukprot:CAMPEP_0117446776 /NCGR_PEP_ID=MMETSP0759-20121206/6524_1 /TAXON_ID=63605 /ORGANISM="Percolomonas cosmopolitus, Strain WS" /LENGTH=329 /DNA_ID=CAMNT_0005239071 /DNA_START=206 /DNA_END=1195 /DNA_ORIENTATION=+
MFFSHRRQSSSSLQNLKFYKNEIKCEPNGGYIDEIHKEWFGDYGKLERRHDYIQWLFPEESSGVNWRATPLNMQEAKAIRADPQLKQRVYRSLILMLDFWGIEVEAEEGDVLHEGGRVYLKRSKDYRRRYNNWMGGHNNLRVCRCIKSLGMLGFEHLQPTFVEFLMHEIVDGQLRGCSSSFESFWLPAVKNDRERKRISAMWKQWNKDKRRKFSTVQWKHSAACRQAAEEGNEVGNCQSTSSSTATISTNNDVPSSSTTHNMPSSEDEESPKEETPASTGTSSRSAGLTVVTSEKFPFTPQDATDDQSIFDIDTSHVESKKRKRNHSEF